MTRTTEQEYRAILAAGIKADPHEGDANQMSDFGAACFNDNSISDLLAIFTSGTVDQVSLDDWSLTNDAALSGVEEALETRAADWEYWNT